MELPDTAPETLPATRHDAFTPELMARFCEVLAETGTVSAAADAVGKSRDTVYQHRRCNPLFAAGWTAALSHARNRLADMLLERSIEGSVDYIYRDGELVGERRYIDNRLAYAMLRRLDKQAEEQPQPVAAELARQQRAPSPQPARDAPDWEVLLTALQGGSERDLREALAMLSAEIGESDKADNPPDPEPDSDTFEPDLPFGTNRIWIDSGDEWKTSYPPPPGFDGDEDGHWAEETYTRDCTDEEVALFDAAREGRLLEFRRADEGEQEETFERLRALAAAARAAALG